MLHLFHVYPVGVDITGNVGGHVIVAHILKVEEKLRDIFGTKVSIRSKNEGGSIDIEFYSPEDLNRLLDIFDNIVMELSCHDAT